MQEPTPREDSEGAKEIPRLSPNSLERRFLAELNQLDSMEMSMKQLTGVERTRAISMAQQESVSLAQMLKVGEMLEIFVLLNPCISSFENSVDPDLLAIELYQFLPIVSLIMSLNMRIIFYSRLG